MLSDIKKAIAPFYLPLPFLLLSRWLLLMFLWIVTQGLFLIVNYDLFYSVSFLEVFCLIFASFRYAISSTLFILTPFLVLNLLPIHYKHNRFIANGVDIAYYPITHQRMDATIFSYLSGAESDFIRLLPMFFVYYWYLTILAIFGIFMLFFVGKRLKLYQPRTINIRYYIRHAVAFLMFIPLILLGQRGGFQGYPISIFHAVQISPNNSNLILNTPFVILKTLGKTGLEEVHYYLTKEELYAEFDPRRHYADKIFEGQDLPNIVILILEGYSSEFSKFLSGGDVGYTPFMDSLAQQGLVFRGMSNSQTSVTGIPAIVAGFPNWMEQRYVFSQYIQNDIPSLANTLGTMGYASSFYHGGFKGTFGFDAFAIRVGFDEYLGKPEYNNDQDCDGKWGIFDKPFMQYAANRMTTHTSQPFLSVIYTLSSHHPYTIPKVYEGHFPKGTLPVHEVVGYTDYALQRFFETARKQPWFENTLFIITSDHSSLLENEYYTTTLGALEIPTIWYFPKYIKPHREEKIMSQIDIMPSILHYVGYDKPFIAFGQSAFDMSAIPYNLNYLSGNYQFVKDGWVLNFMNRQSTSLRRNDRNFAKSPNLMDSEPEVLQRMERTLKAIIQQYNSRVIYNRFME
ncbi:MAG: LTA synthase family protein [Bacteroidales bacterium]|jgi:phosphoglycerol transferase MdoB-like AlkP superfamily enzyme|nr:LTA synthase family protein [Bacteroidales bacterium]